MFLTVFLLAQLVHTGGNLCNNSYFKVFRSVFSLASNAIKLIDEYYGRCFLLDSTEEIPYFLFRLPRNSRHNFWSRYFVKWYLRVLPCNCHSKQSLTRARRPRYHYTSRRCHAQIFKYRGVLQRPLNHLPQLLYRLFHATNILKVYIWLHLIFLELLFQLHLIILLLIVLL